APLTAYVMEGWPGWSVASSSRCSAARRRADAFRCGRSGSSGPPRGIRAAAGGIRAAGSACALLSTTFLLSLAARGTQLALVCLDGIRHRIILPVLPIATVSEHIGSTSPLLLQSASVACGASVLGGHTRR